MRFLLGVDEAGRGPLAGPVAVGLVLAPEGFDIAAEFPGVDDSKKLTEGKREKLFELLVARAAQGDLAYTVEQENAATIDKIGIASAVRRALDRGVLKLTRDDGYTKPFILSGQREFHLLLDGALRAPAVYSQETIIHGDALVPLIGLASIAAKVTRDRLMVALASEYPEYGFEKHKGYGTRAHYDALALHGLSALHRRTFTHLHT